MSVCVYVCVCKSLSHTGLFATPRTIRSMDFSRREYQSEPFPSPGDLPNPGIESRSPALQVDSLPAEPPYKLNISMSGDTNAFLPPSFSLIAHRRKKNKGEQFLRTLITCNRFNPYNNL